MRVSSAALIAVALLLLGMPDRATAEADRAPCAKDFELCRSDCEKRSTGHEECIKQCYEEEEKCEAKQEDDEDEKPAKKKAADKKKPSVQKSSSSRKKSSKTGDSASPKKPSK